MFSHHKIRNLIRKRPRCLQLLIRLQRQMSNSRSILAASQAADTRKRSMCIMHTCIRQQVCVCASVSQMKSRLGDFSFGAHIKIRATQTLATCHRCSHIVKQLHNMLPLQTHTYTNTHMSTYESQLIQYEPQAVCPTMNECRARVE